jgi:hypothetical protein
MVYRKYAPVTLARSTLVLVAPAARRRDPHPLPDHERNPALAELFRRCRALRRDHRVQLLAATTAS